MPDTDSRAASYPRTTLRALGRKRSPASVSVSPDLDRANSVTPSVPSSLRICSDSVGWATPRSTAAWVSDPAATAARK